MLLSIGLSTTKSVSLALGLMLCCYQVAFAQLAGSRGGASQSGHAAAGVPSLETLAPEVANSFITIDGQAELRVPPTEIRVVLAVTAEGDVPAACKQQVEETVRALTNAWLRTGIPQANIVEDFISVLPRYEFTIERVRDQEIAVEKKTGYLMQSNLHLAVRDDAQAMSAIDVAFEHGVSDIIAFDYWSKELDQMKVSTRAQALQAAREKSEVLFETLFTERPPIINLQESTRVIYPESLYTSFANTSDSPYQTAYSRRDLPQLRAFRPQNTYYRGLYLDSDVQPKELPMRAEISVVSTVRLYFQSPAADLAGAHISREAAAR